MQTLELREYEACEAPLSVEERDTLRAAVPSLSVEPVTGQEAVYRLTPGSTVGALELGDLAVSIRPKLEVSLVLFLASYAMGAFRLQDKPYAFEDKATLVEALAPALVAPARRAFGRGRLHGYRTEEEALHTVRGRIMVAEQIRRRFDIPLPVEVRYDDFTDDILPNHLVKAAAAVLGAMHIEDADAREGLRWMDATLANVSRVRFSSSDIPAVTFDRLNEHYREVAELSRLILRYRAIEMDLGEFSPDREEYEGAPGEGVSETTVSAEGLQRGTEVAIHPTDADIETDGHQVALERLTEITVTVISSDGSRTKTYRVAFAPPVMELVLSPTWTSFEWPGTDGIAVREALREGGILDRALVVYEWDEVAQNWEGFFPGLQDVPGLNTLTALEHGHTYWVAVTEPLPWTVAPAEPAGGEPSGEANT